MNTVSDETPERREMIRSTVVTVALAAALLILGLVFWAWSSPDVVETSPVGWLNGISPYLTVVLEVLMMLGFFVFLVVTVINLKMYLTGIRAGWTEVVLLLILVSAMSWLMFGPATGVATAILSMGFIVYLYWLQD